jgi:glycosyltransferase involved in cell wall biosynthesis
MPIRRILMTADTIGGVWTYVIELTKALQPRGIEVILATMGRAASRPQRTQIERLSNVTLYESQYRLEWMEDPWPDVESAGNWLLLLEEMFRPDVIHLNGFVHGSLPWKGPVLIVAHSCVCSWFQAVRGCPPPGDPWDEYRRRVARGLRSASAVTAPSTAMLEAMKPFYSPFAAWEPIYNARSTTHFKPRRKEEVILAAGRVWDEAKNLRMLGRIAPGLPWPVRVAGDTKNPGGGRIRLNGIGYLGNLSEAELGFQLSRASIFVLPARYEPFGLCALEAALAGCALVLGDIPSLREVWGDAALYVPPDDHEGLEQVLQGLIHDRDLRLRVAEACSRRAGAYTPQRMAGRYLDLYERMVGEGDAVTGSPVRARRLKSETGEPL